MNCKEGDTAICIKGRGAGKVSVCKQVVSFDEVAKIILEMTGCDLDQNYSEDVWWEMEDNFKFFKGDVVAAKLPYIRDKVLRPIRDSDEEDEMLTIVGKPHTMENV